MSGEKTETIQQVQTKHPDDFPWPVVGANWFLLIFVVGVAGKWGRLPELLGLLFGYTVGAAVPVCLIFLVTRDKKAFRWRRAITISAWCLLPIWLYGVTSIGR